MTVLPIPLARRAAGTACAAVQSTASLFVAGDRQAFPLLVRAPVSGTLRALRLLGGGISLERAHYEISPKPSQSDNKRTCWVALPDPKRSALGPCAGAFFLSSEV